DSIGGTMKRKVVSLAPLLTFGTLILAISLTGQAQEAALTAYPQVVSADTSGIASPSINRWLGQTRRVFSSPLLAERSALNHRASLHNPHLFGRSLSAEAVMPANMAVFVKTDAATQGNWQGVYGADGHSLANDASSLPSYAQL